MMSDPRMAEMGETMPFDGQRMIVSGFESLVEEGLGGTMGYTDGFLLAVTDGNKAAYREMADTAAAVLLAHGATGGLDCWGYDGKYSQVTGSKPRSTAAAAGTP